MDRVVAVYDRWNRAARESAQQHRTLSMTIALFALSVGTYGAVKWIRPEERWTILSGAGVMICVAAIGGHWLQRRTEQWRIDGAKSATEQSFQQLSNTLKNEGD